MEKVFIYVSLQETVQKPSILIIISLLQVAARLLKAGCDVLQDESKPWPSQGHSSHGHGLLFLLSIGIYYTGGDTVETQLQYRETIPTPAPLSPCLRYQTKVEDSVQLRIQPPSVQRVEERAEETDKTDVTTMSSAQFFKLLKDFRLFLFLIYFYIIIRSNKWK